MKLTTTQKEVMTDCLRMENDLDLADDKMYFPSSEEGRSEVRTMNTLTEKGLMARKHHEGNPVFRLTERGVEMAKVLESENNS